MVQNAINITKKQTLMLIVMGILKKVKTFAKHYQINNGDFVSFISSGACADRTQNTVASPML